MANGRLIPIRDLPKALTQEVHEQIRLHSVSMVIPSADASQGFCCSGTLTHCSGMPGILTARHVWEKISGAPGLILLVGGRPYHLDTHVLEAFGPTRDDALPGVSAKIPDLSFVKIPSLDQRSIEAWGKVFYSLDRRRKDPSITLIDNKGFWILAGSPQALLDSEHRAAASFLYDTTIEKRVEIGDWDYVFINLNLDRNPALPKDYGGVSGGGVWRAKFEVKENQAMFVINDLTRDILLSGVAFYQTAGDAGQIIGHGPRSLYDTLPAYLRSTSST